MRTLRKVSIEGFKSIARAELELGDLNVVIGANGAGKSNLLGVFRLLERALSRKLQFYVGEQGGADRLLFFGKKVTNALEVRFDFGLTGPDPQLLPANGCFQFILTPAVGDTLIYGLERVVCDPHLSDTDDAVTSFTNAGHKESMFSEAGNSDPIRGWFAYISPQVKSWNVYHFNDTSDSSPIKRIADVDDNRFFRPDARNLPAYLYWLQEKHPVQFRHIEEHIRLVAPFFDGFVLAPLKLNERKIQLEWRHKGSDAYFDIYSFSDGTLRFICLATLLLQPDLPALILLDEPELGLHPFAIRILAEMLEAASQKVQVILATQSVTLLDNFAPKDIIVAEHDGRQTVFKRLDEAELEGWLEDYSIGELWEKNVLGGQP
jgi:predicted ATPase